MRVAILGTGNIGTDLLVKVSRSRLLDCVLFSGRSEKSAGIQFAKSRGFKVAANGIHAIIENAETCDIVVDCTSAQDHIKHAEICESLNKKILDLTPAKLGKFCVPAVAELDQVINYNNINLVTCGGQASVPLAAALAQACDSIDYIEVVSTIASKSAGPATRQNLDEYIETTQQAVKQFSGAYATKAILILNPAEPPIDMQTTVYAKIKNPDLDAITTSINRVTAKIQEYVPGYKIIVAPVFDREMVSLTVKVTGAGDYLPAYAGNLDIINCAAVRILEIIASAKHENTN